jgi:putative Mg2+ transporter-C (MgtC) family protein
MEFTDVALRLGSALLIGGALGLNRDLHGQPTGVRTLGLVGLGSALVVLIVSETHDVNALSRVIQGLVTGVGFLCAGVIVHGEATGRVHGLTTAACAWLTACIGAACGAGQWVMLAVAVPLIFLILWLGGPLEQMLRRHGVGPKDK